MRFWNKLFENIEKIHKWGKIKKIFLTNYGWILFGLILCFGFMLASGEFNHYESGENRQF